MSSIALILVAAGAGRRAGGEIPKQYRKIGNKPLLTHTLENSAKTGLFDHILVVISGSDDHAKPLIDNLALSVPVSTTFGGATRTDSVRAGLNALRENAPDHVLIHDAARPFLTRDLIQPLIDALSTHDGAVPALPITDALKTLDGGSANRERFRRVQTPQAFDYAKIMAAFDALPQTEAQDDDIAVAHAAGMSITFTQGSERNFKVTWPEDFAKAEAMITQYYTATGQGFDVHALEPSDKPLMLCGVEVPSNLSLVGHSDADVGLHALTDAILGAIAMGDIGDHFPPSDPKWKGASSDRFLDFAVNAVKARGGVIQHVDVTLICERPKVKPHREAMRQSLARITELPLSRVSLKATTTEKLGFTGRGEGIAAQATATVSLPASDNLT